MRNIDSINRPEFPKDTAPLVPPPPIKPQPKNTNISLLRPAKPKGFRWALKVFLSLIVIVILILGSLITWRASNLSDKIFVGTKTSFFQKIREVIRGGGSEKTLIGENLGQINILLLGIGGAGHEGPYLTDTMIVAQIRPDIGQAVLTSIPRDYLVELPQNLGPGKINAAFAEGYARNKSYNEGGRWALEVAQKITGLKIPYFAVVDFQGFEKAIDQVGGVDVRVENTFSDSQYPDENLGYLPTLTFEAGLEHMNGTRALEYARSRHGTNGEGSDFARSKRQEKIMSALKEKVLQLNLISDASTINRLLGTFADHFHTNISPGEFFRLYKISKEKNINQFLSLSLDGETGLICSKILESNGAFVLVPCEGKTDADVQAYFKNSFAIGRLKAENSVVWLGTSTGDKQTYARADQQLKNAGFSVFEVGFNGSKLPENIVYEINSKPSSLEFIKNTLSATQTSLPPPGIKIDKTKADLIVILGSN